MPLHVLVYPDTRAAVREQMPGFSDAALFHRWMDLFWTFNEPEVVALLTPIEKGYLAEFNAVYASLPWRPIASHPHISEVSDDDLARLLPAATWLLGALNRRREGASGF